MKILSKIIAWILSLIMIFVVANLIIGCIQYGGIKDYAQILDSKDWSETMDQLTIKNPVSIFSIFYEEGDIGFKDTDITTQTGDIAQIEESTDTAPTNKEVIEDNTIIDPYDPEFEDEFNSFFGGEDHEIEAKETTEDLSVNNEVQESQVEDNDRSVGEQLIKKFNE